MEVIDVSRQKKYKTRNYVKQFIIVCSIILINFFYHRSNTRVNTLNNEYINMNKSDWNNEQEVIDKFDKMQEYLIINENGILITDKQFFKKTDTPKISIVITVYNGELFIRQSVRSIQNQNFTDVEIIIVDDSSKDNSVPVIKGLMKEDPRIILLTNKENKGMLYSRARGILNSKGKYILILDVDDMYSDKNCFSLLYEEAKKNDLDILGFSSIISTLNITNKKDRLIYRYFSTPILYQPNISSMMYEVIGENVKRKAGVIWCYMFKTEFFKSVIMNEIDPKYLNRIMNAHDDFLLLFILTRKAKSYKCIKQIVHLYRRKIPTISIKKYNEDKQKRAKLYFCKSYLYYLEFIFLKTENNYKDKLIATNELSKWYLDNKNCNNNSNIIKQGIYVCNLFVNNSYVNKATKYKIILFLKKLNKSFNNTNHFY